MLAEWIVYDELDVYYFQRISILNTKLDKTCHYDPRKCTIFYLKKKRHTIEIPYEAGDAGGRALA